ncbi:MAG: sigma-54 factor interaction domain-containing protein, partial [Gammaproteobacteria bacterium]|nr:sigma-54 factor interaction domain-containing protein [Gammaproteobacteria bacterium]
MLGEEEIPEFAGERLRARLFAEPDARSHFRDLLDVLHKARLCHEHLAGTADSDITRGLAAVQGLIGVSPAIQRVREVVTRLSDTEVNVLITGESGTGKEIVARTLHRISGREGKPFVPVNCGAIPGELLESELFGHERGAFTGAVASTIGRFERAHGGTLFLDEIGDMPLNMQVKILRVLEEGSFEKVGGTRSIEADVRILTATHKNLEDMIDSGEFREDLYYRINLFPIEMPPLRLRVEDIPLILNEF